MDHLSPDLPKLKLSNDIAFTDSAINPLKTMSTMASAVRRDGLFGTDRTFGGSGSHVINKSPFRTPRDQTLSGAFAPSSKVRGPLATNTALIQQKLENLGGRFSVDNKFNRQQAKEGSSLLHHLKAVAIGEMAPVAN